MSRFADLVRFYALLDRLADRVRGRRTLASVGSFNDWPTRGVYFFFEAGEMRRESGEGPRVVRVGTHALTVGSRSTLRQRLTQHRGLNAGGGNHRGSIFRLLVGQALSSRAAAPYCASWGVKGDAETATLALGLPRAELVEAERLVEEAVTRYLGAMRVLWVNVDDEPGPGSVRSVIERSAIALLSNLGREPLDPPSPEWLGFSSDQPLVRGSGLWNQRHVEEAHHGAFLDALGGVIEQTGSRR